MNKNNKKILKLVEDYAAITLGLFIYVTAWVIFMWPKQITGGGVTGIASLIKYSTGMPVGLTYLAINAVLLAIGFKILGKAFGMKTIYAIGITTLFFNIVPFVIPEELIVSLSGKNSDLICAIMAGALAGLGIGISFNSGGSSGGTDIIALIINKYRNISPGRTILYIDFLIIGSSYFFSDSPDAINKTLYGYIMIVVVGYTIDLIVSGQKQSLQIFIISKKYEQIANRLTTELNRGVTAIDGKGWYTKESATILMIIVRKYEGNDIYRVIREEDPHAFISVSNAMGVYGQGFDQIKGKKSEK